MEVPGKSGAIQKPLTLRMPTIEDSGNHRLDVHGLLLSCSFHPELVCLVHWVVWAINPQTYQWRRILRVLGLQWPFQGLIPYSLHPFQEPRIPMSSNRPLKCVVSPLVPLQTNPQQCQSQKTHTHGCLLRIILGAWGVQWSQTKPKEKTTIRGYHLLTELLIPGPLSSKCADSPSFGAALFQPEFFLVWWTLRVCVCVFFFHLGYFFLFVRALGCNIYSQCPWHGSL